MSIVAKRSPISATAELLLLVLLMASLNGLKWKRKDVMARARPLICIELDLTSVNAALVVAYFWFFVEFFVLQWSVRPRVRAFYLHTVSRRLT